MKSNDKVGSQFSNRSIQLLDESKENFRDKRILAEARLAAERLLIDEGMLHSCSPGYFKLKLPLDAAFDFCFDESNKAELRHSMFFCLLHVLEQRWENTYAKFLHALYWFPKWFPESAAMENFRAGKDDFRKWMKTLERERELIRN
jgi:hypothetical protein